MDIILDKCILQNRFLRFQLDMSYAVGTHRNCLIEAILKCTYNICPFNK